MYICCFVILFAADSIWKRFVSIRTDLGKLKKQGKSGQGAKKLTQLQRWKLQRYAFLEAHMKPRTQGEEFRKVHASFRLLSSNLPLVTTLYLLVNVYS